MHQTRWLQFSHFSLSIHHFSDASEQGYGQCSYIRMVGEEGQIHCSLLLGNSRVVPKRFVSVLRLEQTAGVLSVKTAWLLKKELNLGEVTHYFWTDSKVVLGYIRNNARRLKTFVANRICQINENTHVEQWSYIPTRENPADDASRGLNAEWESSNNCWFQRPSFLWQEEKHWPNQDQLKRETKSFASSCPTGRCHWLFRRKNIQLVKIQKNHCIAIFAIKENCFNTLEVRRVRKVPIPLIVMIFLKN